MKQQFNVEVHGLSRLCKDLEDISWCPGSVPRSKLCPVAVNVPGRLYDIIKELVMTESICELILLNA